MSDESILPPGPPPGPHPSAPRLTWAEAVRAMLNGHAVRRASEIWKVQVAPDVYECGTEGCVLAHAWTHDEKPVRVFRGADSGVLFVPEDEHRNATDWIVTS